MHGMSEFFAARRCGWRRVRRVQATAVRVAVAKVAVVRMAEVLAVGLSGDETQMEMAAVGSEEAMLVAAGQGTLGMAHLQPVVAVLLPTEGLQHLARERERLRVSGQGV